MLNSLLMISNIRIFIRIIIFVILILFPFQEIFSQNIIYIREGFPYCESFETLNPRANTVINGTKRVGKNDIPSIPVLTGSSLQLTSNSAEENGYVYIDYPFASNRGVKVSFEYSSYGKTTPEGADGLSFFMFDGSIDPSTFEIGGKGGALGYTSRKAVNGGVLEEDEPGLKGAYLGIGLDEFGNFGNHYENKRYSFLGKGPGDPITSLSSPPPPLAISTFKHSLVLRGPLDPNDVTRKDALNFSSYEFITGKILSQTVYPGVTGKNEQYFLNPIYPRFTVDINSTSEVFECNIEGYRKVFIDLQPDTSTGFYKVNVWMLVNLNGSPTPQLIHVIEDEPYPFIPPPFLKIGFSASTGGSNNFHNIKNVTVEVSDLSTVADPIGQSYSREVCQGGELEFEINPQVDNEAFVRCIQLFEDITSANAAKGATDSNTSNQSFDCGLSGTCFYELCNPDNLKIDTNFGSFETFMEEVSPGSFIQKIRYESNGVLSASGQVTVYYTVVDNFGQMSEPRPITINVIPNPEPVITTIDPLVWEQSEVNNIRVRFEVQPKGQGYTYQWFKDGVAIPGAVSDSYLALGPGAIGAYTVEVTTDKGCFGESVQQVRIRLVENLNPQIPSGGVTRETCDQLGTIKISIDGNEISGVDDQGNPGNEKYRIVSLPSKNVVVNWKFLTSGQNLIMEENLPAGNYLFQIGDQYRSGQPGSDGNPLFRHVIPFEILPIEFPLTLEVNTFAGLCHNDNGSIIAKVDGGKGLYSYYLMQGGVVVSSSPENINHNSYTFNSVPVGTYEVRVLSGPRCEVFESALLSSPPPLNLVVSQFKDVICEPNDGNITWIASGGVGPYKFVSLKKNGNILPSTEFNLTQNNDRFIFKGLSQGSYTLEIADSNGCKAISINDQVISTSPKPSITFDHLLEYCEDQGNVVLIPTLLNSKEIIDPSYTWITPQGDRLVGYLEKDGIEYDLIDNDGDPFTPPHLSVTGLPDGDYTFTIEIRGQETCDQEFSTKFSVLPKPEPILIRNDSVLCFGDNNGEIEVGILNGDIKDFEFKLDGLTQFQDSPIFEKDIFAGDYFVIVRNKKTGCINSLEVNIGEPLPLDINDLIIANPTCGLSNGKISFSISGGVKDYVIEVNNKLISEYSYSQDGDKYEISGLAPNSFDIKVTDANGCVLELIDFLTLVNDEGLPVEISPLETEICFGNSVILVPEFVSPKPEIVSFRWFKDPALTKQIITNLIPDEDGIIFQIDENTGILTIENLKVGKAEYYLEISGKDICPLIEKAQVEVYTEISANIVVENITCFGDKNGTIRIAPSGGTGNYDVSINGSPFSKELVYANLSSGDYFVEIRNEIGCTFSETVTVKTPSGPISINTPTIERASCDLNNGSIRDLEIYGGWGNYTVEWRKDSNTGPVIPGSITEAVNLAPGTYFLIIQDAEGCTGVFDFVIEESSDPEYAIVPPINTCTGENVEIRPIHLAPNPSLPPAAPTEVQWYTDPGRIGLIHNGPDSSNPSITYLIDESDWLNPRLTISGLPAGTYDFFFYVVCTGKEIPVEVSVYDVPSIEVETTPITCFGENNGTFKVTSGAMPEYKYSVDGGPWVDQSSLEALSLSAGTYSLQVNTPAGCTQSLSLFVDGPSAPLSYTTLLGIDPGCGVSNGKLTTSVSGGWLPYSVEVFKNGISQGIQSFSESSIQINGLTPGIYYLIIEDKEGCQLTTNSVTLVDGPTQIAVTNDEICVGGVATLTPNIDPSAPGATFQWFKDQGLTQPILSSATPAADGRIYQINSETGELSISNLTASLTPYSYYVTASGPGVCLGFVGIGKVTVYDQPLATALVTNEACFGDGGKITINTSGGSGVFSYSINGGEFVNSNVFNVSVGIYNIEIKTPEGCTYLVSDIEVKGPSSPLYVSNLSSLNSSCGFDNGQVSFDISGGYAPYQISIFKNDVFSFQQTLANSGQAVINGLGIGTYRFEVNDAQGCKLSISNSTTIIEEPTKVTLQGDVICHGEEASISASLPPNISNPIFTWYFDSEGKKQITNGTLNGISYSENLNGHLDISGLAPNGSPYTFYVKINGNGVCGIGLQPVQVVVKPVPTLRVSNPSVVCDPKGTVDLTDYIEGFNPVIYDYNVVSPNGGALRLDELGAVNITGDYRVSSSLKGTACWNTQQRIRVIIAEEELIANFEYQVDIGDGTLLKNESAQVFENVLFTDLSAGKAIIWNWDFGDGKSSTEQHPIHQYQEKGTYTVVLQVIDSIGCISEYQIIINVSDDYRVMIPNAFTPEGLKNKFFRPYTRGIASMEFYIFNTWGELIYQSNSLEDLGWDGTLNGKFAPNGNYVYRGVFTSRTGEKVQKSGVFILIR